MVHVRHIKGNIIDKVYIYISKKKQTMHYNKNTLVEI